jgi:hypothetical protein
MDQLILLDDYIGAPDFPANLTARTGDLGARLGLPTSVDELGVLCPDVRKAADYLTRKHGSGPFFLGEGSPKHFTEGGAVKPFTTRIGLGYHKGVLIELAEPGLGSGIFTPAAPTQAITVHHLGFWARGDNLRRADRDGADAYFIDRLRGAGHRPQFTGVLDALGVIGRVTIFHTAPQTGGLDLEFLDIRLLWPKGPKIRLAQWLLELGARLQIRTGHRSLRVKSHHQLPPAAG